MQLKDYLSHDWEKIGIVQHRVWQDGWPIDLPQLKRVLRSMVGVTFDDATDSVRLTVTPPPE